MEYNKIEIKDFTLHSDNAFFILRSCDFIEHVYLKPTQLLKMAKVEGIPIEIFEQKLVDCEPVSFKKVVLIPFQNCKQQKCSVEYQLMWEHPTEIIEAIEMIMIEEILGPNYLAANLT